MPSGNPWWDWWAEFIPGTHRVQEVDFRPNTITREATSGGVHLNSDTENEYA